MKLVRCNTSLSFRRETVKPRVELEVVDKGTTRNLSTRVPGSGDTPGYDSSIVLALHGRDREVIIPRCQADVAWWTVVIPTPGVVSRDS